MANAPSQFNLAYVTGYITENNSKMRITDKVYRVKGNSESIVMSELRKSYPKAKDILIENIRWVSSK